MKICVLTNNLDIKNGAGRFSRELIRQLKKNEPKVEIIALTTIGSGFDWEKNILATDKLKLILSLPKIREIFKKYDIIHALDGWPYGVVAALASWKLKKKLIITAIGSGSIKPLYQLGWRWLLRWAYNQADRLIAISVYTAKEINKKIPELKFEVIPLGVDFEFFIGLGKGISLPAEKPYLLSVGRIKPRKGYLESIRAFALISQKMPDLKYVIVGSGRGDYSKKLTDLIQSLNLAGKVIFKENISDDELVALYRHAELFWLLPQNDNYDIEGFGLVFLEAATFGLAVIGSRDCGAEDAVFDNQNGYLVEPKNTEEAAQKVLEILSDNSLKERFSRQSVEIAKKMSYRAMAENYLKIYRN